MIPKVIHYCWFGGNPKPEIIEQCIASWKQYCPDWKIKEWNESNYDINAHEYTKAAYAAKKWAFVSDVARLEIIRSEGGIYLDTDVEILAENPFDEYLKYDELMVFETERAINTGLCFGGRKESALCIALLQPYLTTGYTNQTELVNSLMNRPVFMERYPALRWNGETQIVGNTCILGCEEYTERMKHHGTRSWCDDLPEYKISGFWRLKKTLRKPSIFEFMESKAWLRKLVPVYQFLVYDFLDLGPIYYVKRLILKLRKK